jgi:hypothetical protein
MVTVLTTGPKLRGLKLGRSDECFGMIKIRNTPSFGVEAQPEFPCRYIIWQVKITCKYEQKYLAMLNSHFFRQFLLLLPDDSAGRIGREFWWTI